MSARTREAVTTTWMLHTGLALALAATLLLGGCLAEKEQAEESGSGGLTWTALTAASGVLGSGCQSCHGGSSPQANLSLAADQYAAIVTNGKTTINGLLKIADPGNKANSALYTKTSSGASMELYAGSTGNAAIGAWIDAGAPEN